MTQPLTFACPKCGRRMGVGLEMTGKQVRCPHCRQVVVAPANVPPRPAPPAAESRAERTTTPPEAFAPSTEGEIPVPTFAPPPRREGAESIFGDSEQEDDSLFASPTVGGRPLIPDLPSSMDLRGQQQPSGAIDFNAAAEQERLEKLPATDAIESGNIPKPILGPATPFIKKDISQPDFELFARLDPAKPPPEPVPRPIIIPPTPQLAPPQKSDEVVNPWAKLSRPALSGPGAPPPLLAPPAGRGTLFWVLVSYALAVTLFAVWGWTRGRAHPLSVIPDFFGQYRQADPKKVSALPVNPSHPIPADLRVKLGGKLVLGELEFEPVAVEERKTKWEVKGEPGRTREIECLVLTARVRNVSTAHAFCPLDPAFNRFATADAPHPLTAVVVGTDRYPGGPIPWPFTKGTPEYVVGQEQDGEPLQPGQERTTVVPSIDGEKGQKLINLVRLATAPMLWQVHVRRGFISYQGEDVSVGALIGVEFTADQVKR